MPHAQHDDQPVLWQMRFSHYNEKARWALDHKGLAHARRSVLPGLHVMRAKRLYGGQTLPVLVMDGETIADSTRIVEALERRHPQPALYPEDPAARERALALEDHFDEELGPHIRRAFFHDLLPDARLSVEAFTVGFPRAIRMGFRAAFPLVRPLVRSAFKVDPKGAEVGRAKTIAALDRIEAEVRPGGYLVGDSFTVADLTAAALMSPVVGPPEFAYPLPSRWTGAIEEFRASIRDRPGFEWVREIYRRHRGSSTAVNE